MVCDKSFVVQGRQGHELEEGSGEAQIVGVGARQLGVELYHVMAVRRVHDYRRFKEMYIVPESAREVSLLRKRPSCKH